MVCRINSPSISLTTYRTTFLNPHGRPAVSLVRDSKNLARRADLMEGYAVLLPLALVLVCREFLLFAEVGEGVLLLQEWDG